MAMVDTSVMIDLLRGYPAQKHETLWDFKGDTFYNQWQTYRTRKDRSLLLTAQHTYESAGNYTVLVKVIDIFGNDTTKAVEIEVK